MKKYILMFLFFVLIIFLTFTSLYDEKSFHIIIENIKNINIIYIFLLLFIIFIYFLLQGIYMKTILKCLKEKISLARGIFYSLVEFYFSGITPSSTGGQPVQFIYMTKDKIPIRKTYLTLMLNTIYFKLIVFILGFLVIILRNKYIFSMPRIYIIFFIIGLLVDAIIVILGFLLLFKQNLIRKLYNVLSSLLIKINFFKKKISRINIDNTLQKYQDELEFMKKNKKTILFTFLLTFMQRILMFSVAFIVYRALGFKNCSYLEMLVIQITLQVTIEAFPLPGGAGISEHMLSDIFRNLFGLILADAAMVLTRMFTFYIPLTVSGIIILIYSLKVKMVKKKKLTKR